MSDCPWPSRPDPCNDCWATIVYQLSAHPGDRIMPQPGFCQDAAFVAFMIDSLKAAVKALTEPHPQLEADESQRIGEIFDEARLEAAEADEQ